MGLRVKMATQVSLKSFDDDDDAFNAGFGYDDYLL